MLLLRNDGSRGRPRIVAWIASGIQRNRSSHHSCLKRFPFLVYVVLSSPQ
jgi:hypothetical protein